MEKVIGAKARTVKAEAHHHLLHPLRQRHVQPRQRDPPVYRPDQSGQAHHHHRPGHDPLPDEPGRSRGPCGLCLRARATPATCLCRKSPACTIGDLAKAVQKLFGDTGTHIIGTRHGEKLYETLLTARKNASQRGHGRLLPRGRRRPRSELRQILCQRPGAHPGARGATPATTPAVWTVARGRGKAAEPWQYCERRSCAVRLGETRL